MKSKSFLSLFLIAILVSACNLPSAGSSGSPTQPPVIQPPIAPAPTDTYTPEAPTATFTETLTPTSTDTPTITPTETPSTPMVTPKTDAVNCRYGPGTAYASVGGLKVGAVVPILGRNGDSTWWQITNPNNITTQCWVSASATDTSGDTVGLTVVPAPIPFVTKVTAIKPPDISTPGCLGPITPMTLTGTIETNGPVTVTYHFETQQGGALGSHTITFNKFGPLTVTDNSYTPPLVPGTYWIKLVVTSPNSMNSQVSYSICP